MTKFQTATITVVLAAVGFFSLQALEARQKQILDSLALSIMSSLLEIETAGIDVDEAEPEPIAILVADSADTSAAPTTRETIATLVLPLPPLKSLPRPFCTSRVQLASFRQGPGRFQYDLSREQVHTEIRVVSADSVLTGDWAGLIKSCREKSLKVCVEKSKNSQRVVILDPSIIKARPSTVVAPAQPFS